MYEMLRAAEPWTGAETALSFHSSCRRDEESCDVPKLRWVVTLVCGPETVSNTPLLQYEFWGKKKSWPRPSFVAARLAILGLVGGTRGGRTEQGEK